MGRARKSRASTKISFAPSFVLSSAHSLALYLCGTLIVASIVLGGGSRSGFVGDVILQLLSIPVLLWCSREMWRAPSWNNGIRWSGLICALLILIPLLQLIPLPTGFWASLPGREAISRTYALLGRDLPAQPLSMSPSATWQSALSMLPPLAIFACSLLLSYRERRSVSVLLIVMGVVSVFLGLLQLAQGPESPLRFFAFTNREDAVGFFASRNCYAALLYAIMIFAVCWVIHEAMVVGSLSVKTRFTTSAILWLFVSFTALVAFVGAQAMARSRAGIILSATALIGAFLIAATDRRSRDRGQGASRLLLGIMSFAIVFSLQFALFRILARFSVDPLTDARVLFTAKTFEAAKFYMPFGTGLGTFVPIYAMHEKAPDLLYVYANHAHNDFAEVWLETGIAGPILAGLALLVFLRAAMPVWGRSGLGDASEIDVALMKAATLVLVLFAAHSLVDYPLRTAAIMAVSAFSCGLLVAPLSRDKSVHKGAARTVELDHALERMAHSARTSRLPDNPLSALIEPTIALTKPAERWEGTEAWPEAWRPKANDKSDDRDATPATTQGKPPATDPPEKPQ